MLFEEIFPLRDSGDVIAFKLYPPVGFQFVESYTVCQLRVSLLKELTYTWSDDTPI